MTHGMMGEPDGKKAGRRNGSHLEGTICSILLFILQNSIMNDRTEDNTFKKIRDFEILGNLVPETTNTNDSFVFFFFLAKYISGDDEPQHATTSRNGPLDSTNHVTCSSWAESRSLIRNGKSEHNKKIKNRIQFYERECKPF